MRTASSQGRWLPRLAEGTDIPCFGLTGPSVTIDDDADKFLCVGKNYHAHDEKNEARGSGDLATAGRKASIGAGYRISPKTTINVSVGAGLTRGSTIAHIARAALEGFGDALDVAARQRDGLRAARCFANAFDFNPSTGIFANRGSASYRCMSA